MPYIKKELREQLGPRSIAPPASAGGLNFQLTELCRSYLDNMGRTYATMNQIVGALECAKLEFYRRAVAAYEDEKIKENGDVY